jgi:plastocyanin
LLQAPGLDRSSFSLNFEEIKVTLMDLAPNRFGTITLGWYGCLTCTLTAAQVNADITADVTVALAGDVDPSNNGSSATARGLLSSPIIGLVVPRAENALCNNEVIEGIAVTNRTTVELRGRAAPNGQVEIYDGATLLATVPSDANGNFGHNATFSEGLHNILAKYIVSPRDASSGLATGRLRLQVKPSLPFDPASLCFVDSQNRSFTLSTLGYSWGASQSGSWLRSGETYQVSLSGLGNDPNAYAKVTFNDLVISSLLDSDGDGIYVGTATFPELIQAAGLNAAGTLGLIVGDVANESRFTAEVTSAPAGTVVDGRSNQPLADAEVTLLQAQEVEDGATVSTAFVVQGAAQLTASDGLYSLNAATGLYRIDVRRTGYQPYRSGTIDVAQSALNRTIALQPEVLAATTHTVYLTANGFAPATLTVTPGSVIEFVNIDLVDHGAVGSGWDSGLLATGASYKVTVSQTGTFGYRDSGDTLNQGTLIVSTATVEPDHALYLPLVQR